MTEQSPKSEVPSTEQPLPAAAPPPGPRRQSWRSEDLLGEDSEALILHNGETYRLRRTRHGKLILYK